MILLSSLLFPGDVTYAEIGSYAQGVAQMGSDLDFLFHEADRHRVLDHLEHHLGAEFSPGLEGSQKFKVSLSTHNSRFQAPTSVVVNVAFVPTQQDFDAWVKATEVLKGLLSSDTTRGLIRTKSARLGVFAELVHQFGGTKPAAQVY